MLKIIVKEDTVKLKTLKTGDCFMCRDELFRLCCHSNGTGILTRIDCSVAYNFTRNIVEYVGCSRDVTPINLELSYA